MKNQKYRFCSAKKFGKPRSLIWGYIPVCLLGLSVIGCTQNRMPASLNSLVPGQGITGQWEPDVDYEAEAAKGETQKGETETEK